MDPQSCTRGSARARLWLGLMIATGLLASGGPAAHAMTEARASETAAQPTLLASCDGPPESSASGPGSYRYAQTFVPEVSGTLTTAQVDIAKAPGSSGDWIMQVVLSVVLPIGAPSQQVLASTTVPDSTVPDGPSTITGSFADYLLPTSTDAPPITAVTLEEAPSASNPLGAKGAGEVGMIATGAAIANAVANALSPLGVKITALPLSLTNLAASIRAARAKS